MTQARGAGSPNIVIVGAGVIGLSTGLLLQEKVPDTSSITIVAAEFPSQSPAETGKSVQDSTSSADYASMWAGAHYRPIPFLSPSNPAYPSLSPQQCRFHAQLANEHNLTLHTAETMRRLARSEPRSGVQIVTGGEYLERPPVENLSLRTGDVYAGIDDKFTVLDQDELDTMNTKHAQPTTSGKVKWACEYETYVVNVHLYCQFLLDKFIKAGGRTIKRRLHELSEALDILPQNPPQQSRMQPLIINCSGLGVPSLSDPKTKIIRGQTVLVRNKFDKTLTRQCADGTWSFLIPRPLNGGTIVGGTKQIDDLDVSVRSEEREKLLENAVKYFPEFVSDMDDFEVITDNVGRRPWREGGVRIEVDQDMLRGRAVVVHGYGAGGRGYELSWGIASQICALMQTHLQSKQLAAKL